MRELWPFVKSVGRYWWGLMSCAAFTAIGFVAAVRNWTNIWIASSMGLLAFLFFVLAVYLAWRKEYLKNIGGAEIVIEWLSLEPGSFQTSRYDQIVFMNRGSDWSQSLIVGKFSRPDLEWHHPIEVPSLGPGEKRAVDAHFSRVTAPNAHTVGYMRRILEQTDADPVAIPLLYSNTRGATYSRLFTLRLAQVGREREVQCVPSQPKLISYK